MVQWLGLYILTATAEGMGSIPAWGVNILQAMQCSQKLIKKKKKVTWSLQQTVSGKLDINMQKNEAGPLFYPTYKN